MFALFHFDPIYFTLTELERSKSEYIVAVFPCLSFNRTDTALLMILALTTNTCFRGINGDVTRSIVTRSVSPFHKFAN